MSSPGRNQNSGDGTDSRPGSRRSARPRPGTVGGVGGSFGAATSSTTAAITAAKAANRAAGAGSPIFLNNYSAPVNNPGSPLVRPHTAPDRLAPTPLRSRQPPPSRGPSPTPSSPLVLLSPIQVPPTTPVRSGRAWSSHLGDVYISNSNDDDSWHHHNGSGDRKNNRNGVHDRAKKPRNSSLWNVPNEMAVPQSHLSSNYPVRSPLREWRKQLRKQTATAPREAKKQWGDDSISWDEPLSPLSGNGGVIVGGHEPTGTSSSARAAKVRAQVHTSGRWVQSGVTEPRMSKSAASSVKSEGNRKTPMPVFDNEGSKKKTR